MLFLNFEIPIVIDEENLNEIPSRNKYVRFLLFWLQERNTKCVVLKSSWKKFNEHWNNSLNEGEVKECFFRFIRGIARPYRKEGHEDEKEDMNPTEEIIKVVNRDYDAVEFLLVKNPDLYKVKSIKLSHDNIFDLRGFYTIHEVNNSKIFQDYARLNEEE